MRKTFVRSVALLVLTVIALSAVAFTGVQRQQGSGRSSEGKKKALKDIAAERDVEISGGIESQSEYETLEELANDASAIVYGRIIDAYSFFDESSPLEYGENITTGYTVEIYRVLKDTKLKHKLEPGQATPAPLMTPLKIMRNGGVVEVNGHKAEVKVKGYESLKPGRQYVFFLFWSTAYKAYVLAGGASGAVMVNDDQSLTPLASSDTIKGKLRGVNLKTFVGRLCNIAN